jgi:hypothetical protein
MYPFYTEISRSFYALNSRNMVETKRPTIVLKYTNVNMVYFRVLSARRWELHTLQNIFVTEESGPMDIL